MDARMESLRQDVRKNPAELEREADRARDAVEVTLHELERQLSPSELAHRVIDTVKRNGGGFGANLLSQVRSNPVPALLVGFGVAWLMLSPKRAGQSYASEKDRSGAEESSTELAGAIEGGGPGWRDRWSSAVDSLHETASAETNDAARGAMSATASAARTAASTIRGAAGAVTNAASRTVSATRRATEGMTQASQGGVQRVAEGYSYLSREQPLVLGALAVVVGAAIGALLPSTDAEDGWLGGVSDEAKARLKSEARSKADDVQAAARSAAATVQQSMSKATKGNGAEPLAPDGDEPGDDTTKLEQARASAGAETSTTR